MAPDEFHLFPFLPAELRLQIWRLALSPRVVVLTQSFTSPTPPPTLLSVCHESRQESLRSLVLLPLINTYFHPGTDILYYPRPVSPLGYSTPSPPADICLELITKVAVDYVSSEIRREWEVYNKYSFLKSFPNLEEGYLVINAQESSSSSSSGNGDRGNRAIELIDPRGDKEEIMGIMERVRESFCYELPAPSPVEEDGEGEKVEREEAEEEEKEKWVDGRIEYNGLELVPKAMVWGGCAGGVVGVCG
ncbi:hypothetical protein QC764_123180 [Podospora pseudoanserina]|uniref:2EXR domain-containing protein n=1 Tax=Podospora pseudoanserina TaxID=2609844 RepID=A0ABR0IS88_9PEZI|nr:hypothetical protein QC764_123180 [Podospora pseudoanserina]